MSYGEFGDIKIKLHVQDCCYCATADNLGQRATQAERCHWSGVIIMWGVTAGKASHKAGNARGVTAGKMEHNSSIDNTIKIAEQYVYRVHGERCSSVVECRTRNRESPGSKPLCYHFEVWAFLFSSRRLSRLSCTNEYLAVDSGGNVSE